ncbi:nucleotidyltransferase domain-containing protein [candidate division KSB1 bacterium]|nr:nucleotidyltransferase domain-containing protein [candidate division KSB1 bacterium]
MNAEDLHAILAELKQRLTDLYGERLERLVLYGSQARGDAQPDSDIDVLVVLRGEVNGWKEILNAEDATSAVSLKFGVFVAPLFIAESEFRRGDRPLLNNVRTEGIRL